MRSKIGPLDASTNFLPLKDIFLNTILSETISIFNSGDDTIYIQPLNIPEKIIINVEPEKLTVGQAGEIKLILNTTDSEFGKYILPCSFEIIQNKTKTIGNISVTYNIVEDFESLSEKDAANPPVIKTADLIDLGKVEPNEITTRVITVENLGKRDLLIHRITSSNSMYSITPKKLAIAPGKTGAFKISLFPTIERNNIISKLTIISNDPQSSVINCTITGKVVQSDLQQSSVIDVSILEAESIIANQQGNVNFVILDVRTKPEYEAGCINEAVNIDFKAPDFRKIISLLDKNKIYLVYCRSGFRSLRSIEIMAELGYENIYHMQDGFDGWKAQGLEFIFPKK
ncbi:MAG: DUF1573 domain-containing protein [Candidatus Cloacimonetes bacterium]|nr:DUF1573 domain-containing protein [Candidatus Cloacimonadota bacterium]